MRMARWPPTSDPTLPLRSSQDAGRDRSLRRDRPPAVVALLRLPAVHRVFTVSFIGRTLRYVRNAAGFSQRFTLTVSNDGDTMTGRAELSRDGTTWENDLAITYQRVR